MRRYSITGRERYTSDGMAVNIRDFTLREEGQENPELLLIRPNISLYSLDLIRRDAVFVATPDHVDLESAPFYYHAQFEHAENLFTVDFETFIELARRIDPPNLLIMIHNIGRCGSTLLSRMFLPLEGCTSFSEPDSFTQMAFWRTPNDPRDELWRSLLPACMKFTFKNSSAQKNGIAIVKFRSGCLNLLDLFLSGFPEAKHYFLYRDCGSWVDSLMRLIGRHVPMRDLSLTEALTNCRNNNGRLLDQSAFPFERLPPILSAPERLAISWLVYLEHVSNIHQTNAGALLPMTYQELSANSESCMRNVFAECGLPREYLSASLSALQHDSQAGTPFARIDGDSNISRALSQTDSLRMQSILDMHPFINDGQYSLSTKGS